MLSIAVMAGGESRRMGQDKALMDFLGKPLIERVIGRVKPLADELFIITNRVEEFAYLDFPKVSDVIPGRGALGGLYTALHHARSFVVAVVACDMPFVSVDLLRAEHAYLLESSWDAVIPQTDHGTEPFHAVYSREECLPAIKTALDSGAWRVDAWYSQVHIAYLSPEAVSQYDPDGRAFWNLNTPEDFRKAETIAQIEEGEK